MNNMNEVFHNGRSYTLDDVKECQVMITEVEQGNRQKTNPFDFVMMSKDYKNKVISFY